MRKMRVTLDDMPTAIEVARANGLANVVLAWTAAKQAGIPFHIACAFLEQESRGMNVFGHDGGADGWFSGAGEVTETKYAAYKNGRASHMAQGVGPMQLTWPPFQDRADAAGGCWRPLVNMRIGFQILMDLIRAGKSWHEAAAAYNGSETYADQVDVKIERWRQLLAGATDPGGDVPEDNRYQRIPYHGHKFDRMTVQALMEVEEMLGYELTITQGSYNSSVPQSGGTHDGGGAADLVPWHYEEKVLALRKVGFAAWHRPYIPGLWGEHIHCELLGNEMASSGAKAQWDDYRNRRNGLADHGPDDGPRLDPIPMFHYQPGGKVAPPEQDPPPKDPPPPREPGRYAQELAIQQSIGDAIRGIESFQKNFPIFGREWNAIEVELKALWLKAHENVNP